MTKRSKSLRESSVFLGRSKLENTGEQVWVFIRNTIAHRPRGCVLKEEIKPRKEIDGTGRSETNAEVKCQRCGDIRAESEDAARVQGYRETLGEA